MHSNFLSPLGLHVPLLQGLGEQGWGVVGPGVVVHSVPFIPQWGPQFVPV